MNFSLHQQLSQWLFETGNEAEVIDKINNLCATDGEVVLQTFFKLIANINVPLPACSHHWAKCLEHQEKISRVLGRKVALATTLCDYLQTSTDLLPHACLIDVSTYNHIVHETIHDKLTGLYNRPYFDEAFVQQTSLACRYQHDLTVLFLDLDNFKTVNDTYGHLAGDLVLQKVSETILREKRDSDIAARFGGEEFVLLLTHTDNLSAYALGERLRRAIAAQEITYQGEHIPVTVSGGIASYPLNSTSPDELLKMADSAVYLAKGEGRNRICQYKEEKRRYLRVKISQPILAKELDFEKSVIHSGTSKNISVGGLLFENPEELALGTLVTLQISVNNAEPLIIIGKVVRIEQFEDGRFDIGVTTSFKELDKIATNEVAEILKKDPGLQDFPRGWPGSESRSS
jgi:diguanylate cyclase (GGDEF)-like protein